MPHKDPAESRQYRRNFYRRTRREKRLRAVQLLGGKCHSCPETNPAMLEFSHELGQKEIPAKNLWALRWSRIEAEIAKCRLRCQACHSMIDPHRAFPTGKARDGMIDPYRAAPAVDDDSQYLDEIPF